MSLSTEQRLARVEQDIDRLQSIDSTFSLGMAYSQFLSLYGLRAFWPMGSFDSGLSPADISGQGRALTFSGFGTPTLVGTADIPVYQISGSAPSLTRASETAISFSTQAICLCGWIYNTTNVTNYCMAKQSSYEMYVEAGGNLLFRVYSGGSSFDVRQSLALNTWSFVAGIFNPSTYTVAYVNGSYTLNNVSIPASLTTNANQFQIGGVTSSTFYITMAAITGGIIYTRVLDRIYNLSKSLFTV